MSAFTWPPEGAPAGVEPGAPAEQIPAAVLVAVFISAPAGEPHVVLTRRRSDLRRHAGEISFPGGRWDPEDGELAQTAMREAEEEIGLPPSRVRLLGELQRTSTLATNYVIHPWVGAIPADLAWELSPREVEEVLELPLEAIRDGRTRTRLQRRGISFETDAFIVSGQTIWGATARILESLLERLEVSGGDLALRPLGDGSAG